MDWLGIIVTAVLMLLRQTEVIALLGKGNTAMGLTGGKLIIGIIGNFFFGALMTVGVGLYAPCMALVYMLGMTPLAAFPIMMCSCAGLQPVASINFIREKAYSRKIALAITIGGIPGVIIASQFLMNLDISMVTYLVIVIIFYTGIQYILKSRKTVLA